MVLMFPVKVREPSAPHFRREQLKEFKKTCRGDSIVLGIDADQLLSTLSQNCFPHNNITIQPIQQCPTSIPMR